jgi:hypothetical protein
VAVPYAAVPVAWSHFFKTSTEDNRQIRSVTDKKMTDMTDKKRRSRNEILKKDKRRILKKDKERQDNDKLKKKTKERYDNDSRHAYQKGSLGQRPIHWKRSPYVMSLDIRDEKDGNNLTKM